MIDRRINLLRGKGKFGLEYLINLGGGLRAGILMDLKRIEEII